MRKIYTTKSYKKKHKRRLDYLDKKKQKEKKRFKPYLRGLRVVNSTLLKKHTIINNPINAPLDFRLIENTTECLEFLKNIRKPENHSYIKGKEIVRICLKNIHKLDYASVSALLAIVQDLNCRNIHVNGDIPMDIECKNMMVESGFLHHMYDMSGKNFTRQVKSETIFFEKGQGKLSEYDNKKLSDVVKNVVVYLTGEGQQCKPIKSLLLEICGNSIEHAETINKQWLLGVKYEKDRVLFSVTDVGRGILKTLHKKFGKKVFDKLLVKDNLAILKGAFDKKYGSKTQEINRNKGLPSIKLNSQKGALVNLIVITNNVTLHFENAELSSTLNTKYAQFNGTLYQWELTQESINKASNDNEDYNYKD